MSRQIRVTVATARKATAIDLSPQHACNEAVMRSVFRSEEYAVAVRSREDMSIALPKLTMIGRLRNFELCASILDVQRDNALRSGLIAFRDAVLEAAHDETLTITFAIGVAIFGGVDEDALRIDPDRYLSPIRQQELIGLADAGQGASAVRLAVRETAASFSRQLQLH